MKEKEKQIATVIVKPGKYPYMCRIENTLEEKQKIVDGTVQAIYPYEDMVAIICNDDGKTCGLPPNRAIFDEDGLCMDVICGNFIVTGIDDEGNFTSLTEEQQEHFLALFKEPELFAKSGQDLYRIFYDGHDIKREKLVWAD